MNYSREKAEAILYDQPPIDPSYYRRYSDVVDRIGVDWLERTIEDWDNDHTARRRDRSEG